jgi:hypothetical protein
MRPLSVAGRLNPMTMDTDDHAGRSHLTTDLDHDLCLVVDDADVHITIMVHQASAIPGQRVADIHLAILPARFQNSMYANNLNIHQDV